jgi:3-oxoacyl-[acyl-carrier protein] reductase
MTNARVTGAGSAEGIGFATARLPAARGMQVTITSTSERIHERAAELGLRGVVADLTDWDDAQRLVAEAGRLDVALRSCERARTRRSGARARRTRSRR